MYLHEKLPTRPPYSINKVFGYCGEYVAFYIVTVVFRLIPFDIFALLSPLYQWYLGGISDPDSHSWRPPPPHSTTKRALHLFSREYFSSFFPRRIAPKYA